MRLLAMTTSSLSSQAIADNLRGMNNASNNPSATTHPDSSSTTGTGPNDQRGGSSKDRGGNAGVASGANTVGAEDESPLPSNKQNGNEATVASADAAHDDSDQNTKGHKTKKRKKSKKKPHRGHTSQDTQGESSQPPTGSDPRSGKATGSTSTSTEADQDVAEVVHAGPISRHRKTSRPSQPAVVPEGAGNIVGDHAVGAPRESAIDGNSDA